MVGQHYDGMAKKVVGLHLFPLNVSATGWRGHRHTAGLPIQGSQRATRMIMAYHGPLSPDLAVDNRSEVMSDLFFFPGIPQWLLGHSGLVSTS